jgi:hypothetical protein
LPALLTEPPDAEAVALTFDLGLVSFAELARPGLRDHGLTATMFVVADHVGGTSAWGAPARRGIPVLPLMSQETRGRLVPAGVSSGVTPERQILRDEVHAAIRFFPRLPSFLRQPITSEEAHATLRQRRENRGADFLVFVRRAICSTWPARTASCSRTSAASTAISSV